MSQIFLKQHGFKLYFGLFITWSLINWGKEQLYLCTEFNWLKVGSFLSSSGAVNLTITIRGHKALFIPFAPEDPRSNRGLWVCRERVTAAKSPCEVPGTWSRPVCPWMPALEIRIYVRAEVPSVSTSSPTICKKHLVTWRPNPSILVYLRAHLNLHFPGFAIEVEGLLSVNCWSLIGITSFHCIHHVFLIVQLFNFALKWAAVVQSV
jgi:hypothetical protein